MPELTEPPPQFYCHMYSCGRKMTLFSQDPQLQPLFIIQLIVHTQECDGGGTHMCHNIHVEARDNSGVSSPLLPLHVFQDRT